MWLDTAAVRPYQVQTCVADAEKWLESQITGLHRVLFCGDHTRTLERMGRLTGFEVVREG